MINSLHQILQVRIEIKEGQKDLSQVAALLVVERGDGRETVDKGFDLGRTRHLHVPLSAGSRECC